MMQCPNCGSWDTDYEYIYLSNEPIHFAFNCNNCNTRYGKDLVGDEKGYSIKLKEKDSEWMKRIFITLLIIALYELSKAITYEVIVKKQANDMVDKTPMDYEIDLSKRL